MSNVVKIAKWGNSCGIRIPVNVLRKAEIEINDLVYIEADPDGTILINKKPSPKKGTIEYLFKDYSEERFRTELVDLGEPVGKEKW